MTRSLVPSNHRRFEHALAEVFTSWRAISPVAIEQVWDAWRCPATLLPFQAYALSVDFWDESWDEVRQRRAIAESPAAHRRKGTRAAIEDAAGYTGRTATIIEWWQFASPRRRGTFSVTIHLADGETAALAGELLLLKRLVTAAKPKSRAFAMQASHLEVVTVPVGVGIMAGSGAMLMVPPDDLGLEFEPFVWMQPGSGASLEVQ